MMETGMDSRHLGRIIIRIWCWVGGFGKWGGVNSKTTPEFLVWSVGSIETNFGGKIISLLYVCWIGVPCGPSGWSHLVGGALLWGWRAGLEIELWEMQWLAHCLVPKRCLINIYEMPQILQTCLPVGLLWGNWGSGLHLKAFFFSEGIVICWVGEAGDGVLDLCREELLNSPTI